MKRTLASIELEKIANELIMLRDEKDRQIDLLEANYRIECEKVYQSFGMTREQFEAKWIAQGGRRSR